LYERNKGEFFRRVTQNRGKGKASHVMEGVLGQRLQSRHCGSGRRTEVARAIRGKQHFDQQRAERGIPTRLNILQSVWEVPARNIRPIRVTIGDIVGELPLKIDDALDNGEQGEVCRLDTTES
jgi:hypothetical protein